MKCRDMSLKIAINSESSGKYREESINGRPHLVTNMISIEGDSVMNRLFYPFDEVNSSYQQLDNLLAPASHPQENGENVFIRDNPTAINAYNVGAFVRNPTLENNVVKNELVFDIEVASKDDRGREAIRRIKSGDKIGVSTGLTADRFNKDGVFNGVEYDAEARNLRFDHVAFLLDEPPAGQNTFTVNSELFVCNLGTQAENLNNHEVIPMDKDKLVLAIIGNSHNGYTQADKDALSGMSEESLVNALYSKPIEKEFTVEDATKVLETAGLTVNSSDFDKEGYQDFVTNKDAFKAFKAEKQSARDEIVSKIVANSKMTQEQVESMSDEFLANMLDTVCPPKADQSANNQGAIVNHDNVSPITLHEGA